MAGRNGDPAAGHSPGRADQLVLHGGRRDARLPDHPDRGASVPQSKAHIGHNAIVEAHARVCAGSVICGHARVGAGASVSGNSWVKPWVTIGEGAIIGGGSVVTKDVPAHEVWAGNPARFMKLAWTHPEHVSEREPHPFEDPDEMWQMMRPWHHRGAPA